MRSPFLWVLTKWEWAYTDVGNSSQTCDLAEPGLAASHSGISVSSRKTGCQSHRCVDRKELICSGEGNVWKHFLPCTGWYGSVQQGREEVYLLVHRCLSALGGLHEEDMMCALQAGSSCVWCWKILSWDLSTPHLLALQDSGHRSMTTYWLWGFFSHTAG